MPFSLELNDSFTGLSDRYWFDSHCHFDFDVFDADRDQHWQLLKHFGGWREVESATQEELSKVEGISHKIAQDIYAALHPS